jgi:hypothetical protein
VLGVGDPYELADGLADFLLGATNGHVQPSLTTVDPLLAFPPRSDGSVYTAEQYAHCLADAQQCLPELDADVAAISVERELCDKVWQHSLDEIWLLGAPHFGFAPLRSLECTFSQTGFVKHVDVVGLDFERGLDGLVASYQERSHAALLDAFAVQSSSEDDPYADFTSACGKPSFAPNASESGRFDDPKSISSSCEAFYDYPLAGDASAVTTATSCQAWGCTERGFRRYWFSHLPRARWLDEKGRLNDFWRMASRPDERHGITSAEPICSSSYTPGWCSYLDDGEHEKCNEGEWATQLQQTGFVELFYEPKRLVTSITLYDRTCDEQVKAGHIEFSDGSPDRAFGELDNGTPENPAGKPKMLSFEPKLLSGFRVVIDQSSGGNPGLAEVTVASTKP